MKEKKEKPNDDWVYVHCKKCLEEFRALSSRPEFKLSPRMYSYTQAAYTRVGLIIWCNRHNEKVIHLDLREWKASYL